MKAEDLDKIEAAAKAATPGPWEALARGRQAWLLLSGGEEVVGCSSDGEVLLSSNEDRDFIALAHPKTVLELVARVRELEAKYERCVGCGGRDPLKPWFASGRGVWVETFAGCGGPDPQPPEGERIGEFNTDGQAELAAACVNACAGLNPEAVPKLVETLEGIEELAESRLADMPGGPLPQLGKVASVAREALALASPGGEAKGVSAAGGEGRP